MFEIFDTVKAHLWLGCVSIVGSLLGYFRKQYPDDLDKDLGHKLGSWLMSMATSMFAAVVVYQLSSLVIEGINVRVAVAGLASFSGTDLLVALEKRLIQKIGGNV